jgi:hypothetical protein
MSEALSHAFSFSAPPAPNHALLVLLPGAAGSEILFAIVIFRKAALLQQSWWITLIAFHPMISGP